MSMIDFCSVRDEDEQRLHALATKTKSILKELADEMTKRRKDLSRVRFFDWLRDPFYDCFTFSIEWFGNDN